MSDVYYNALRLNRPPLQLQRAYDREKVMSVIINVVLLTCCFSAFRSIFLRSLWALLLEPVGKPSFPDPGY